MDRFIAMILLLGMLAIFVLAILAFFALAPITCSCLLSLAYSLYLFMAYEESGIHYAQEFENRFWTIFGMLLSTALFFAQDSPLAFGRHYSSSLGFVAVILCGFFMHIWDRHHHRLSISQQTQMRRTSTACSSLTTLNTLGIRVEDQLDRINACLLDIDQRLLPSTLNNFINERSVLAKEQEIISIFDDCDARALNYLVGHVKLALLFYKVKDHRTLGGQHRSQLINLLAVDRLAILTPVARVIVLHSLQLLKLRANPKAENWVKNIILKTTQDDLSFMKTLMDSKGDYFCMTKLIYDDLSSVAVREEILTHIRHEAAVQQAHMQMGTQRSKKRRLYAWRKILSDVDDTLLSSGGHYPAGVDKRYAKKVVYPGVLAFYRELDLGTKGPDEWPEGREGNLVFLSARPHVYKDMSEKANFRKFEKMRATGEDGRRGMHATPSLLAGDIQSGTNYIFSNDFEHLAVKKFDNFRRYVSIFPEYKHVFVADNGQGDVRAGDMMHDQYPYEFEAMYVHVVMDRMKTHGYDPDKFRKKDFYPCFFTTYPEAAVHAATIAKPPLISMKGLRRVCFDATKDFQAISENKWPTISTKAERRQELNQSIWRANFILEDAGLEPVPIVEAEQLWMEGQSVRTPYGIGLILSFDPVKNLYEVDLDWRPLDVQFAEHLTIQRNETILPRTNNNQTNGSNDSSNKLTLDTVIEIEEIEDNAYILDQGRPHSDSFNVVITASQTGNEPSAAQVEKILGKIPTASNTDGTSGGGATKASESNANANDNVNPVAISLDTDQSKNNSNSDDSIVKRAKATENYNSCKVKAFVAGHQITKYTPPGLPTLDKTRGSMFTFWSPTAKSKKEPFNAGDHCKTPYGNATIVEYRPKQQMVVVDMVGWTAQACLREGDVKIVSKGLIRSLFRKMSGHEVMSSKTKEDQKAKDFPHAEGTVIHTPYGKGAVTKPLQKIKATAKKSEIPAPPDNQAATPKATSSDNAIETTAARPGSGSIGSQKPQPGVPTLGISLTSWTLADGSSPVLYCTVDNAQTWRDQNDGKGIISATVDLVSKTLLGPFLHHQNKEKKEEAKEAPREEQYFRIAAGVNTQYGMGVVSGFRPEDGFYAVSLSSWTLSDGSHPVAYLKRGDINVRIAKACQEGYPVYTRLGLTGVLASVQPQTGVHIVAVASAGMVCYLQPEEVIRPIKAAVGDEVLTAYGDGVVERYRIEDDTYQILLKDWHGAKLYAKAECFDRVHDMQDKASFGMKWIYDMFFSDSKGGTGTRSRSNSIASGRSKTS